MSVGGSLIVPGEIDTGFLKRIKHLIEEQVATRGRRFIVITGGGRTARTYQTAASSVAELDPDDLDWLGIHVTRLNGQLFKTVCKELAYRIVITNPDDIARVPADVPLVVAAGWRPGSSTDLRAVQIAGRVGAAKMVNLSNTDYVYTADPKKDMAAEKIADITWEAFRKLIPTEWDPGLSAPFDPVAAAEAEKLGMEVAAINGAKLEELEHYLAGSPFIGTRIHA
jgi:uridylate kinase